MSFGMIDFLGVFKLILVRHGSIGRVHRALARFLARIGDAHPVVQPILPATKIEIAKSQVFQMLTLGWRHWSLANRGKLPGSGPPAWLPPQILPAPP